jgi:phosphate transport system substrate-binding protein
LQALWLRVSTWASIFVAALTLVGCAGNKVTSAADGASGEPPSVTRIENKGSDTIVNLALAWAEAYVPLHSNVRISVTGGGSGTGIAALINGTVDLANASREMKPEEIQAAKKNGIDPVQHTIARDAIAVVVNPQNPINELTIPQLSDIFTGQITNWSELGGLNAPIVLLSRESNSGTYTYFLENVIRRGDAKNGSLFSPETLLMPSSEGISNEIRQNPNCIGYDGLGYVTSDQKTIKVSAGLGKPFIPPSIQTVENGSYPISRGLYMYTAGEPHGALNDYLNWISGPDGQKIVSQLGFVPLKN